MSEKSLWTLIVVAGLVLVGVLAWRKGLLSRVFGPPGNQLGGYPQAFAGGLGPNEIGPAAPAGGSSGSAYGKACNFVYQAGGKAAAAAPDPRAQAVGVAAQVGGPAICAAHEWVAGKAVSGAKATASAVGTGAKSVASGVASVFKKIF